VRPLAGQQLLDDGCGLLGGHVEVDQPLDLRDREHAADRCGLRPGEPDERRCLGPLVGVLAGGDGHEDIGRDVEEERPEDPVREGVERREAEQRRGPQDGEPERALGQERRGKHVLGGEGRDDQRVEPDGEAEDDPRGRPRAVPAPPREPQEHGRRALGHGDEGQQPHLDEQELPGLDLRPGLRLGIDGILVHQLEGDATRLGCDDFAGGTLLCLGLHGPSFLTSLTGAKHTGREMVGEDTRRWQ